MTAQKSQKNAKYLPKQKTTFQKIWHFLWYEDSVASWVVSILLAFILIKFILYPLLGLVFGTQFPVVAVVSCSMEHNGSFDAWWTSQEDLYLRFNITKEEFKDYSMNNGFNKGDLIFLKGIDPAKLQKGNIIVFWGGKEYPIIHRIVSVEKESNGTPFFQTKGDHNLGQIVPTQSSPSLDERHISADMIIGKAGFKVPLLGWVKIGVTDGIYEAICLINHNSNSCLAYQESKQMTC